MATYYVNQAGAGSHNGNSLANAYSVAEHNAASFSGGDIIYPCDTITSQVVPPSSGASDVSRITYRGDYADHAGSINGVSSASGGALQISGKNYLTMQSLTVTNRTATGDCAGIWVFNSDGIKIASCTVTENEGFGIWIWYLCDSWIVEDTTVSLNEMTGLLAGADNANHNGPGIIRRCTFDANGQSGDSGHCTPGNTGSCYYHGIYIDVDTDGTTEIYHNKLINGRCGHGVKAKSGVNIHHNFFKNNSNYNLYHVGASGVVSTQIAHHNILISPNGYGIGAEHNIFFYKESAATTTVYTYNNTLYSADSVGIQSAWDEAGAGKGPTNWYIRNNIIYSGTARGIVFPTDGIPTGTLEIDYNLVYSSAASEYLYDDVARSFAQWQGLGFDANGKCDEDPLLNNPGSDECWLQAGSPCIDTGEDLGDDYDDALNQNSSWPDSVNTLDADVSGWDMGAYEYAGGDPPDAPFSNDLAMILQ